jgi:predicted nucleic acid-binding Zn ribbon protein
MTRSEAGKLGYEKTKTKLKISREKQQAEAQARWVPTKCLTCGKDIPYEKRQNKFCDHSCATSFTNRGVQHNKAKPGINPEGKCLNCGTDVGVQRKFCSNHCFSGYHYQKKILIDLASGKDLEALLKTDAGRRRFLLRTRPNQCDICKNTDWQGQPIPLVMDHIDGDSTNWDIKNLRLICPNCDAQTDTYKGRNRGKGRHSRRLRYQQGLSY